MKISIIIFTAIIFLNVSCHTKKVAFTNENISDHIKTKYPDYTLADLNRSKILYENNCGSCHGLKNPKDHSEEQWQKIVPKMVAMVNKKSTKLNEQQQEDILKYVVAMGLAQ